MVDLGNIKMIEKDQGRVIKMSNLGPCDGHEDASWWPLLVMQNRKVLMHFGENVYHFDEVLFEVGGFSVNTFVPWLFGIILSLAAR